MRMHMQMQNPWFCWFLRAEIFLPPDRHNRAERRNLSFVITFRSIYESADIRESRVIYDVGVSRCRSVSTAKEMDGWRYPELTNENLLLIKVCEGRVTCNHPTITPFQ